MKSLLGQRIKSYDNLYFPHQIVIDASLFFISHFEKLAGICFLHVLVLYSKNVLSQYCLVNLYMLNSHCVFL